MADYNEGINTRRDDDGRWRVFLDHQCEEWDIAGEYGRFVPKEVAELALAHFISEAEQALQDLRINKETDSREKT